MAFTKSKAKARGFILDLGFFADEITYDFSKDGSGISDVDIRKADGSGYDMTDLDQYELFTYFDNRSEQEGEEIAWSLDASYFVDLGFIYKVDFGTRLSERTAFNQEADTGGRGNISGARIPLTDFSGLEDYTPENYMEGVAELNNTQWLTPNADYLLRNRADIRQAMGYSRDEPEFIPGKFYDNSENNYALYVKANLETEIAGMLLDGHFGTRIVRLNSSFSGNLTTYQNDVEINTPVDENSGTTEVLPSLSLRLSLSDDLYLRTAYGKTITRPGFADLNPAVVYDKFSETSVIRTGSGGNPYLNSTESTNYDVSLEWYFAEGGSVTAATFYREIEGYIQRYASPEEFQGETYFVTRPQNTSGGSLEGIEVTYTQFFEQLPGALSGLGIQLNGTFMDGETENLAGELEPLIHVSDESYNGVLLYELGSLSARLAYNWRSDWVSDYNAVGEQPGTAIVNTPIDSLDFAINYDVNENLTVSVEGTNLTDSYSKNYFGGSAPADEYLYPRDTILRDRTFSVGIRFRM
ncbi:TonB-dependent receptor [Catenovulum sediminis]|uniref:TonB-dependent receptor n=1 Tax=Catenovulum sediminis TaxID=1740262 RepID=UPI001FE244F5|nr:TonB-dependent receptor [Catenovulum sediminis]